MFKMVSKLATSLGLEGLSMVDSNWEKTNTIRNMLDGGMHVRKLSKKALIISTDSNHLVFYMYILYIYIYTYIHVGLLVFLQPEPKKRHFGAQVEDHPGKACAAALTQLEAEMAAPKNLSQNEATKTT